MKRLIPLLLLLFFLSLLSNRTRRAPWYEQWVWNAASPLTHLLAWTKTKTGSGWDHYIHLAGVAKENEALRNANQELKLKLMSLQAVQQENSRLAQLLELKQIQRPQGIAARVIAFDPNSEFRTIQIDKGSRDGIKSDLPVVALGGLVGRVGPVFKRSAHVLLIVDPASHVDVVAPRSQVRSLLSGSGLLSHAELRHGYFLTQLEYLKKETDIAVGDTVMTSGLDRLYPAGIVVGTLTNLKRDHYGVFLKAEVLPAVDFSKLKEVLVLGD